MLQTRFLPHSVYVNSAAGTNLWINQVESTSPDQNVTLFEETSGSATDREFTAVKSISPTIPMVTSDLSSLATIGMAGVAITSGGTGTPGCVVYARELPLESTPAPIGSAVHLSIAVSDGMLIPQSVSASHNETAKLNFMLHAILGNGTNSLATPMAMTANATIPAGGAGTVNLYTTGICKYTISGGATRLVQGIQQQSVDFGIKLMKEGDSGEVYMTQVAIIERNPRLSFTTKDQELITELGAGASISSFAMYFRAINQNGQRVANATTSHVSISGTAGMVVPKQTSMRHKQAGAASFDYVPSLNTNLLTISTAAAIPTT